METILTHLNVESESGLQFIGEGNEHIVLGLSDTENVLRFRKFALEERISREDFMLRVQDDLSFINDVARPLAGPLLVDEAHLVSVDPLLLEKVMERIKPLRDEKRYGKMVNEYGIGILTPNVATHFVERRRTDLKIRPKILNFQRSCDVITVSTDAFPFSKSVGNSESSDAAGNSIDERISSRSKIGSLYPEDLILNESHKQTILGKVPPGDEITDSTISKLISRNKYTGLSTLMDSKRHSIEECQPSSIICIELKPKQGYMEPGPQNHLLCRFCIKQYLKIETKAEPIQSSYCPRDLFSGDPSRMEEAIQNLFLCPQNNLKIFTNGTRIRNLNQYSYLSKLIVKILTYDRNAVLQRETKTNGTIVSPYPSPKSCLPADVIRMNVQNGTYNKTSTGNKPNSILQGSMLSPSSFLGRLLYLQSLGSVYEVDAADLYRELTRRIPPNHSHNLLTNFEFFNHKPTRFEDSKSVDDQEYDLSSSSVICKEKLGDLEMEVILQLLQECMVTMSAKDASLMMLIDGPHKQSSATETSSVTSPFWIEFPPDEGKWYKCQASLVDIAQKSPRKILEHEKALEKLETRLIKLKLNKNEPPCYQTRKRKRDEV